MQRLSQTHNPQVSSTWSMGNWFTRLMPYISWEEIERAEKGLRRKKKNRPMSIFLKANNRCNSHQIFRKVAFFYIDGVLKRWLVLFLIKGIVSFFYPLNLIFFLNPKNCIYGIAENLNTTQWVRNTFYAIKWLNFFYKENASILYMFLKLWTINTSQSSKRWMKSGSPIKDHLVRNW